MEGKWKYVRDNQQYSINIWILNGLSSPGNPKMLYGCAVPIEGQVPLKRWFSSRVDSQKKIDLTIEKLSCFITGEDTKNFIDMLEKSRTFEEISINLGLNNPQNYFDKLLLLADDYRYRPPVFLETREATMYFRDGLRPVSTLAANPCICESLTNINKFKLLETDDEMSGKELLTFIRNVLTKELPLEIPGPDSQRVGDFEIFNFAYESSNDVAPLESSIIKDDENGQLKGDAVEISIKPNRFKGKVYLRCRTRNGNVIIGDQLRLIENGNINQNVIFRILENCSEIEVSIWDAEVEVSEQPITLLYEHRIPLMRTINMTMQLAGIQGKLETNWTNKMSSKSGNKSINNEFRRVSRSYSKTGGFENDPWVPASRDIMDFIKMSFPQKSNASFFEKGWQDENRFVKWLQEVVGKYKTHRVILIDPYFDAEAVSKFLGLANYNDLTYEVITDIGLEESKGNEITEACIKIKAILPGSVNIYGLARVNGGSEQIFHDRFMILLGEGQTPSVYMLSNSISGVAKRFPSVVIPVPNDVGNELVEYYLQLTSGKGKYDIPEVNVTTLWPVEISKKDNEQDNQKEKNSQFPGFQYLKAILFDNGVVPEEQLGSENKLLFAEDFSEKIKQFEKLGEGVNRLLKENPPKAIELWCGIANWSVRIMDDSRNEMFDWFNQSKCRSDFISVTKLCIRKGVELDYPLGVKNMECSAECIGIGKQSILPFEKMRGISSSLLDHHYGHDYPVNYSLNMAFHYLMRFAPEAAYEVLGSTIDFVSKMDHKKPTADMMPYYKVIATSLYGVALNLSRKYIRADFSQIDIGLKSNVAIIRAMYVIIISQYLNSRDNLDKDIDIFEVVDRLNFLESPCERIYAYSWVAYDCQVLRNRMRDNQVCSDLMDYLKKKIVDEWSLDSEDEKFLRSILKNFSGPTEGDHSNDIFEILELLVKQSKISQQKAADYIRQLLLEKINNHIDGIKSIYTEVDIPFTYNSIICFSNISSEKIDELVNDVLKIAKKAKRQLMKPFARSKSYSEWKDSIEVLCWCGIAIAQINVHLQSEKEYIVEELKEIQQILLPHIEDFNDDLKLLQIFRKDYNESN